MYPETGGFVTSAGKAKTTKSAVPALPWVERTYLAILYVYSMPVVVWSISPFIGTHIHIPRQQNRPLVYKMIATVRQERTDENKLISIIKMNDRYKVNRVKILNPLHGSFHTNSQGCNSLHFPNLVNRRLLAIMPEREGCSVKSSFSCTSPQVWSPCLPRWSLQAPGSQWMPQIEVHWFARFNTESRYRLVTIEISQLGIMPTRACNLSRFLWHVGLLGPKQQILCSQ